MQETIKETGTAPIEWKVVLPEGANALPMKCSMYSSGDYWTPFQDLQMQGAEHPHTEGTLQALMGLRTVSALTPGLEVTIGGILHPKHREVMRVSGPLRKVDLYRFPELSTNSFPRRESPSTTSSGNDAATSMRAMM